MRPLLYVVAVVAAGFVVATTVASTLQMLEASRHVGEVPLEAADDRQRGNSP